MKALVGLKKKYAEAAKKKDTKDKFYAKKVMANDENGNHRWFNTNIVSDTIESVEVSEAVMEDVLVTFDDGNRDPIDDVLTVNKYIDGSIKIQLLYGNIKGVLITNKEDRDNEPDEENEEC